MSKILKIMTSPENLQICELRVGLRENLYLGCLYICMPIGEGSSVRNYGSPKTWNFLLYQIRMLVFKAHSVFIRVADPDPHGFTFIGVASSGSAFNLWIRIQEGKNDPQKKSKECSCFEVLDVLRAEGFSCSLGILYEGLGISKLQFFIKNIKQKFPAVNFFQF